MPMRGRSRLVTTAIRRLCTGPLRMTPGARLQAVIEILVALAARPEGLPAETVINDYLRQRRYIGSKDRRPVTPMNLDLLRPHPPIACWLAWDWKTVAYEKSVSVRGPPAGLRHNNKKKKQ